MESIRFHLIKILFSLSVLCRLQLFMCHRWLGMGRCVMIWLFRWLHPIIMTILLMLLLGGRVACMKYICEIDAIAPRTTISHNAISCRRCNAVDILFTIDVMINLVQLPLQIRCECTQNWYPWYSLSHSISRTHIVMLIKLTTSLIPNMCLVSAVRRQQQCVTRQPDDISTTHYRLLTVRLRVLSLPLFLSFFPFSSSHSRLSTNSKYYISVRRTHTLIFRIHFVTITMYLRYAVACGIAFLYE